MSQAHLPDRTTQPWEIKQLNLAFRGIISPPEVLSISNSTPTYLYDKRLPLTTAAHFTRDLVHALVLLNPNAAGTYLYVAINQIVDPSVGLYHMLLDGGMQQNITQYVQPEFVTILASGAGTAAIAYIVNHPNTQAAP